MTAQMDYWRDVVGEAFDDAGISATDEQIATVAQWVEGAHENYGMAFGHDVASANLQAEKRREADELRQRLHYEETVPRRRCESCKGHGYIKDGWGRDFPCDECRGEGSIRAYQFRPVA